jgi:hypothetical protein
LLDNLLGAADACAAFGDPMRRLLLRPRHGLPSLALATLLAAVGAAAVPSIATAACASTDTDYFGPCGPQFSVRCPRRLQAGATATYRVRVHKRRRGKHQLRSSLDVAVLTGDRSRRIHRLRRGRTRTFTLTREVLARLSLCVDVQATGPGLRPVADRTCAPVS